MTDTQRTAVLELLAKIEALAGREESVKKLHELAESDPSMYGRADSASFDLWEVKADLLDEVVPLLRRLAGPIPPPPCEYPPGCPEPAATGLRLCTNHHDKLSRLLG